MPILPPALDDRNFDSLVEELLARIPAHTPEWTNPVPGDPGRTLIELFSWLGETILYRANLIPERQRLVFLRLLGAGLRPAIPARGLVSLQIQDDNQTGAVDCPPFSTVNKPLIFETRGAIAVLPVQAELYYKRALTPQEQQDPALREVIEGLRVVYGLPGRVRPYVTTPIFASGQPEPAGFDLAADAVVDHCLWIALLAPKKGQVEAVRATLGSTDSGTNRLINIGVVPTLEVPALFEEIGPRARIPHVWEISGVGANGQATYSTLESVEDEDTTLGLTQRGVLRLALPDARRIGAPSNDVRERLNAGVGDQPPRLDNAAKADRLVAWLRLRPDAQTPLTRLSLSWVGVNVVEVDQRQTVTSRVIGASSGAADQELTLPGRPVEPETLRIEVEEDQYREWRAVDDLALAGRDSAVFELDPEAGTIRFGDGLRGRVPAPGKRIRVARARIGGGAAGNLPPGSLKDFTNRDPAGRSVPLKVIQTLPTLGGEDDETLAEAEQRIPALFRHKDRAVTTEDYRRLAADTPGVHLGRVDVLPRFRPYQRQEDVPGVVSVMVLPHKDGFNPPSPRPDRPLLEAVRSTLDVRRPLATELYVIACEYIPLGLSVGITVRSGFAAGDGDQPISREGVIANVREALRRFLWALPPGGVDGQGWPLGRAVRDQELEVIVARVPGVSTVGRVNLFVWDTDRWRMLPRTTADAAVELPLDHWQLPELLSVVVVTDEEAPADLDEAANPLADPSAVAIPVIPKVC